MPGLRIPPLASHCLWVTHGRRCDLNKTAPQGQAGHGEGCSYGSAAAKGPSRCTLEKRSVTIVLSALKEKSKELEGEEPIC